MSTSNTNGIIKIEKDQFELIQGEFTPDDAQDIVINLIQKKINFHSTRNFGNFIRFGSADEEWSLKRIADLKQSEEEIRKLINQAKKEGKNLKIQSNISIEFI
jgi:hypothetical protein